MPKLVRTSHRNLPVPRIIGVFAVLVLLVSCSNSFTIKPNIPDRKSEVIFYNSGFMYESRFSPCLQELILFQDTSPLTVAWKIRSSQNECVSVRSVELGRLPAGFREEVPFERLPPGTMVHVSAREGSGRWGGSDAWALP